jgi:small GTP-binding protein
LTATSAKISQRPNSAKSCTCDVHEHKCAFCAGEHGTLFRIEIRGSSIENENDPFKFDILDTAGQEEFSSMQDQWMRDCNAIVIVYSITSKGSFERAQRLRDVVDRYKDGVQIPLVLVGNKSDLAADRAVTVEEAKAYAEKRGMTFFEASAKTGANVEQSFLELVRLERQYSAKKMNCCCSIL